MPEKSNSLRVFLSAAEPSADAHCAGLIRAMRAAGGGDIEFVGIGGPKMAEAGCELLETTVGRAVMLYKAFSQVGHYYRLIRRVGAYLRANRVDLVVVCDSPSFNFHIAKAAKKAGIKTLFYVAPQLWAWGAWRIGKLRRLCDRLCCILPFEREWFAGRGVDAEFVGNPLLDEVRTGGEGHRRYEGSQTWPLTIALMPGSRAAEIETLWEPMQRIAMRVRKRYPGAVFKVVAVDKRRRGLLAESQLEGFECEYSVSTVNRTAGNADFALVASGSATLQVAAAGCPMAIMYQSSRLLWHLVGRFLIKTRYLSLVNILAQRELVPEFMPYFSSIEPIVEKVVEMLGDRQGLERLSGELLELVEPLAEKKAGEEVAKIALEMLD